ncbi:unnamed protein product [Ranitomeya imitator]|uniref:Transposase n=1 Tax=Ranitomeya imitator TaxID=111125 RepID=A0ABN9LX94_9NEOB|nr:unnamed protein product [Ranitomeya imitator]
MIVDPHRIKFLDTMVIKNDEGFLSTDLYIKSTDRNSLLHFHSFHPNPVKKSIPSSQIQRVNRIVSDNTIREQCQRELHTRFRERGYPDQILNSCRATNRQTGAKTDNCIPFVHSYHPYAYILHRTIRRHWHLLGEAHPNIPEFNQPFLPCFKRVPNIYYIKLNIFTMPRQRQALQLVKDKLVRADLGRESLPLCQLTLHQPRCGTFPCMHCNQCGNVQKGNAIYHPHSGKQFKIKDYYTCDTSYVVYLIKCPCGLGYVGETTQPIKDRISKHKSTIRCRNLLLPIPKHFADHNHRVSQLRFQVIEQVFTPRRGGNCIRRSINIGYSNLDIISTCSYLCTFAADITPRSLKRFLLFKELTPHIRPQEWTWMSDICNILQNFEDCTKMVSGDDAIISITIPILSILKNSLLTIKEDALQAEHEDMEQGNIQEDYTQPSLMSSQCGLVGNEEEEEQELLSCAIKGTTNTSVLASVQRGWPENREEEDEEDSIISRSVDPRYKENFQSLLPEAERCTKMLKYHRALLAELLRKFPCENAGSRCKSLLYNQGLQARETEVQSSSRRGTMAKFWDSFLRPSHRGGTEARGAVTRSAMFGKMVREYLADRTNILRDSSVPFNYWVSKLDMWHELALYALEVLACPPASVLSERVFSAAGGIITDKRIHLSTENADRLTLRKMNKAWIGKDFCTPPSENSET